MSLLSVSDINSNEMDCAITMIFIYFCSDIVNAKKMEISPEAGVVLKSIKEFK